MQKSLLIALDEGWHTRESGGAIAIAIYLRGLHDLAIHALNPRYGSLALTWVLSESGVDAGLSPLEGEGVNLEQRSPSDRASLLFFASWLARDWPVRFIEMVRELRRRGYRPALPNAESPFWMLARGLEALKTMRRENNLAERAAASEVLKGRRGWPSTPTDLVRFVSTGQTPPIRGKKRPASRQVKQFFEATDRRVEAMQSRRYALMRAARMAVEGLYLPIPFDTAPPSTEDEFRESPEHRAIIQELRFTFRAETQADDADG
ncbi:hypothetical protein OPU71_20695 [Niveibacterium sp. 24ML]|uniref:hypothetical protein n=1 Tax=Niveibacterium sp. 24ML TaxID=2985512 RepID=UPI00226EF0CB|nr:hypothetical protein [Niveibacterium sp. 24ML]MCX9158548.1 hypothetical protein [Niveibacterium sp. 24ML]